MFLLCVYDYCLRRYRPVWNTKNDGLALLRDARAHGDLTVGIFKNDLRASHIIRNLSGDFLDALQGPFFIFRKFDT